MRLVLLWTLLRMTGEQIRAEMQRDDSPYRYALGEFDPAIWTDGYRGLTSNANMGAFQGSGDVLYVFEGNSGIPVAAVHKYDAGIEVPSEQFGDSPKFIASAKRRAARLRQRITAQETQMKARARVAAAMDAAGDVNAGRTPEMIARDDDRAPSRLTGCRRPLERRLNAASRRGGCRIGRVVPVTPARRFSRLR
jgi:hypothetical protein